MGRKPPWVVGRSGDDCGWGKRSCSMSDSGCWKHPGAGSSASYQAEGRRTCCHGRMWGLFLVPIAQVGGDIWPRVSATGLAAFCPNYPVACP